MAINNKVKVPVVGAGNRSVLMNPGATEGAVFGKDLFYGDGKTVVTLANLAAALGITTQQAQAVILWQQITAVPVNLVDIAALTENGFLVRNPDGSWRLVPTPAVRGDQGDPGEPGEPGVPGQAGKAGAAGVAGAAGPPGMDGATGDDGMPGPPGQPGAQGVQGLVGAQGPQGPICFPPDDSSASVDWQLPPHDPGAPTTWLAKHKFVALAPSVQVGSNSTQGTIVLGNTDTYNSNPATGDPAHIFDLVNDNGVLQVMRLSTYGTPGSGLFENNFHWDRARGTLAVPTAVQNGDFFMSMGYRGWDASGSMSQSQAAYQAVALENWTSTKHGVGFVWQLTAVGQNARQAALLLQNTAGFVDAIVGDGLASARVLSFGNTQALDLHGGQAGTGAHMLLTGASHATLPLQLFCVANTMTFRDSAANGYFVASSTAVAIGNTVQFAPITLSGNIAINGSSAGGIIATFKSASTFDADIIFGSNQSDGIIGAAGGASGIINGSAAHDVCIRSITTGRILFSVDNGSTGFGFNGNATTGATAGALATANKPTAGVTTTLWLPFRVGTTQYYIPLFA